ncbi:unnamed protein product [Cercopithifilaria johnstoni]|uniref:Uncharacterized protein n=1 Tax=Cercopithifilaria johnstoni TaxID=2874296 RepID=A0A8J2Q2K1_9BILA|nr:unnamed protein product [Cercopithifilaria johnstoni]
MKFVQKFMQIGRTTTHFQQLDAEPRIAGNSSSIFPGGPPPSYRSSTNADDSATFSTAESSSVATPTYSIKRRNSWTNLIASNENSCKKDLLHYMEPLYATTTGCVNIAMPAFYTWTGNIYGNNYQFPEKYNLNGRYAKHFTPFYVLNSAGDPIAISKLELTFQNCGSLYKLNGSKKLSTNFSKRDRMNELREWFQKPKNKSYAFIILFLIITFCIIAAILLLNKQFTRESRKFSWIPPLIFRNQQGNSTVVRMYQNDHQVRFEVLGNLPIKNNYIAIYDFAVRRIAIIDSTLKDNGKNLACFVVNMNISTMPDKYSLEIGAQNAFKRTEQIRGWEEAWNFLPGSYFGNSSTLFNPPIPECDGARWILLNYTKSDQRGKKCNDCYDFCLPELGIERDYLRAETFLNIIRRNCFYLFVPEWRSFAAAYNGKQNEYDFQQLYYQGLNHVNSANSNKSSSSNGGDGKYGDRLNGIHSVIDDIIHPITDQYRNFESKWISLQEIPLPSPSYSKQIKQYSPSSVDHKNSFTEILQPYQNFGSGNIRQQNSAFGSSNNIGQFASATKFSSHPNSYNSQLPSGQTFNGLLNTMSIDGKNNQPKSIYDQSIEDGESISKKSNHYTPQPGIDVYMQQAGNTEQNNQNDGPGNQQSANDQGWITVS